MTCISVIVPCYNTAPFLSQCLDSLLSQDFDKSYNIILIDCKSDSGEEEIGKKYEKENPGKVFYYRYEKNSGPSLSRNLGILHSSGEFLTFIDGDDYVSKDYLSTLYSRERKTGADVITGGYYLDLGKKTVKGYSRTSFTGNGKKALKKLRRSPLRKRRTFCWGRLYKKSLLVSCGILFDQTQRKYEDTLFFFQVRLNSAKVCYLKKPIYYYRRHKSSLRNREGNNIREHLVAFKKAKEYTKLHAPERTKKLFGKLWLARKLQFSYDFNSSIEAKNKKAKKEIKRREKKIFSVEK